MKLKRKNKGKKWFTIRLFVLFLCVALIAAYFLWGTDYVSHVYLSLMEKTKAEHQEFTFQIESATKELAKMPNLDAELEQQLVHAQELLASEQNKMPSVLNINNLIRTIIEIADWYQVKAIPLKTKPSESEIINGYSYGHWHISMSVNGEFQDIVDFVDKLDGKDISTATVVSIVLERDDKNLESLSIQNDTTLVSGTMELVVYTRSLDNKEDSS